MENKAPLKDGGGPSTSSMPSEESDNILKEIQEKSFGEMENMDDKPMEGEEFKNLHEAIEEGNLEEYFRAESIRKNLKKDEFIGVLFQDKYEVVRRFLLSALEEKSFENLTKEFFEDLEFLCSVLKRFVEECGYVFSYYESNLKFETIARIVKSLFEGFENTVDPNCLNKFVLALRSKLSSFYNWYLIGGCLTVKMIKILFNGNYNVKLIHGFCFVKLIKVYSIRNDDLKLMFGVVAYYSNPEEIIKLLSECISIENSGECDSNKRENENREAESLLKVLKFKDSDGRSLLSYAAFNVRIETIPKILEFSKKILGKELFINGIIGSGEYKKTMDDFIDNADFNRICGILKTFHCLFREQIDIFFNENLKFRILENILRYELSNEFEEIINVFKECFRMEKVKEALLSCDYLIHILVNRDIVKHKNVIKNLNIVGNILVDSEMKQFLMFKNRKSQNIFHYVAKNENVNFGDLLEFCSNYLEKCEIEEMLTSCDDEDGWNVLHILFQWNSTERIIECLDIIKKSLDNDELFKNLLKGETKYKSNIFHFAAVNENEIDISILSSHFQCENEIKELLIGRIVNGDTILHFGANLDSRNLLHLFEYSFVKVDKSQFEELIMATNINDGDTFLHQFVKRYNIDLGEELVINLIKSFKEKVSDDIFKELLRIRNERGETFLQVKNENREEYSERLIECFKTNLEESLIEELLNKNLNSDSDDEEHSDDDLLCD